ncbi:MAG: hypothetical protein ACI4J6_11780 [Oscillospiraceae bacterium]
MKKSLIIVAVLGIAVAAGTVWYIENNKKNNNQNNQEPIEKESDAKKTSYSNLNEQKSMVASTISDRHSVAAQIIRETLDEDNEDNFEVSESVHKVDYDEIDSSLDKLID